MVDLLSATRRITSLIDSSHEGVTPEIGSLVRLIVSCVIFMPSPRTSGLGLYSFTWYGSVGAGQALSRMPAFSTWARRLRPITSPSRGGTAFPMRRPMAVIRTLWPLGTNRYFRGKDWSRAASRRLRPRSCSGCPKRPLPKPWQRVVIVGAGLFHSIRP